MYNIRGVLSVRKFSYINLKNRVLNLIAQKFGKNIGKTSLDEYRAREIIDIVIIITYEPRLSQIVIDRR